MAHPKILIAVITCHKFKGRANMQRTTWIPELANLPPDKPIDLKFFLGQGPGEPAEDEVFLDVPDDYDNLPYKTRAAMKWAVEHDYQLVLKCDDDVYIFPERLVFALPTTSYEGRINHSQHKIAPTGWCSGFAYWLSGDALRIISEHTGVPENKAEDLWVGMTLSKHGIKCKVQHNFQVLIHMNHEGWREFKNSVIVALADENMLVDMHKTFKANYLPPSNLPATGNRGSQARLNRAFMVRRRGKWLG